MGALVACDLDDHDRDRSDFDVLSNAPVDSTFSPSQTATTSRPSITGRSSGRRHRSSFAGSTSLNHVIQAFLNARPRTAFWPLPPTLSGRTVWNGRETREVGAVQVDGYVRVSTVAGSTFEAALWHLDMIVVGAPSLGERRRENVEGRRNGVAPNGSSRAAALRQERYRYRSTTAARTSTASRDRCTLSTPALRSIDGRGGRSTHRRLSLRGGPLQRSR